MHRSLLAPLLVLPLLAAGSARAAEPWLADGAFLRDLSILQQGMAERVAASRVVRKAARQLEKEDAFRMVLSELEGSGVPEEYVRAVFFEPGPQVLEEVVARFSSPGIVRTDEELRQILEGRIARGASFYLENKALLARIVERYGVDPFLLVAVAGVESRYGARAVQYPVFDALYTALLRVKGRADFAAHELAALLRICRAEDIHPGSIGGSYAGAFGFTQFMPSSFLAYAVDFDGDSKRGWTSWPDALASTANYLRQNGYKPKGGFSRGGAVWKSIYAYNHSDKYVREVLKLRSDIIQRLPPEERPAPPPAPKKPPKKKPTHRR
ncbi:MAG: lytic murein transglycosylase [Elusimicrobiota bacterium]